jgi:hypothetical protein
MLDRLPTASKSVLGDATPEGTKPYSARANALGVATLEGFEPSIFTLKG